MSSLSSHRIVQCHLFVRCDLSGLYASWGTCISLIFTCNTRSNGTDNHGWFCHAPATQCGSVLNLVARLCCDYCCRCRRNVCLCPNQRTKVFRVNPAWNPLRILQLICARCEFVSGLPMHSSSLFILEPELKFKGPHCVHMTDVFYKSMLTVFKHRGWTHPIPILLPICRYL